MTTKISIRKSLGSIALLFLGIVFNSQVTAQGVFMKSLSFNDSSGIFNSVDNIFETSDKNYLIFEHRLTTQEMLGQIIITDSLFYPIKSLKLKKQISALPGADLFTDIIQLPDSGFAISVKVASSSNSGVGIIRLDKNLQIVSQKQIFEAIVGLYPHKLGLMNDSVLIIGCTYLGGLPQGRSGYLRTDLNGNLISYSFRRIGVHNPDLVTPTITSDNFILTTFINPIQFGSVYKTQIGMIKYNVNGGVQWSKLFVDTTAAYESVEVKELPNGNFLICGGRPLYNGSPNYNGFIFAVSPTGQMLWSKYLNQANFSYNNIDILNNDTIVLTGTEFLGQYQVITLINSNGTVYGSYQFQPAPLSSLSSSMVTSDAKLITKTSGINGSIKTYFLYHSDITAMSICNGTPLPLTENIMSFADSSGVSGAIYSFTVTNANFGFITDTIPPVLNNECTTLSVEENSLNAYISLFPNPSNGLLNIKFIADSKKAAEFIIIENTGREVMAGNLIPGSNFLNISKLNKGVYIMKIISNTEIMTKRFIKM